MKWETCTLNDICDKANGHIQTGPFGSQLHQSDYSDTGTPVVMPKDIIDGRISEVQIARVEDQHVLRLSRHQVNVGDILFSRRGDVGRCAYISEKEAGWLCGTGCLRVTVDADLSDSKYVFYYLQQPSSIEWIEKHAIGATMLNLNTGILASVPLLLPDLPTQHRIASILSAYDDLIENNRRQIKLLEEAAQRLYREWFVELRFPGHEDVKIVDGVPEGWRKLSIADGLVMYIGGGWGKDTPTGKYTIPGKVIRGTDINDIKNGFFADVPLRYHTENDMKKRKLNNYDIVFELSNGNIDNIGRCLMTDDLLLQNCGDNTICASFCKLLRPVDEITAYTLYWEIQDMQSSGRMLPLKKHGSNGINNFDFEGFLKHEFLIPQSKSYIAPLMGIMQKVSNIQSQFAFLREARDRLLPKLMGGEMEVQS